jgi:RsiW-degrading membrane proteinase PrsW (M82 family)
MGGVIFQLIIRISLVEEAGRLGALILLFRFCGGLRGSDMASPSVGAATGLAAGLGFFMVETLSYGAANPAISLFRTVTAAPLHGACGARVGIAVLSFKDEKVLGTMRFLSAVAIHGMYDFFLISPGIPALLPCLIALAAFIASIQVIRQA